MARLAAPKGDSRRIKGDGFDAGRAHGALVQCVHGRIETSEQVGCGDPVRRLVLREAILRNWVIYPALGSHAVDNYSYVKLPHSVES